MIFWPDVSHYQVPVDDRFTRPFLMYKISEGATYVDPNAAHNGAWCHANSGQGKKLIGYGGYHVWTPGNEQLQASLFFANAELSPHFIAMIDVESWVDPATGRARYRGDHSPSINRLVSLFVAKLGRQRVKVYGNSGDLADLYRTRPAWLGLVKARYSTAPPAEPWDGWQYTDGSNNYPTPSGWPRSSAPFGNCDHNAFAGTLAQFAAAFGLPSPVVPAPAQATPSTAPTTRRRRNRMSFLVQVDSKECERANVAWPGWQVCDGFSVSHVATPADLAMYQATGLKTSAKPMSLAQYRSLGGKTVAKS